MAVRSPRVALHRLEKVARLLARTIAVHTYLARKQIQVKHSHRPCHRGGRGVIGRIPSATSQVPPGVVSKSVRPHRKRSRNCCGWSAATPDISVSAASPPRTGVWSPTPPRPWCPSWSARGLPGADRQVKTDRPPSAQLRLAGAAQQNRRYLARRPRRAALAEVLKELDDAQIDSLTKGLEVLDTMTPTDYRSDDN